MKKTVGKLITEHNDKGHTLDDHIEEYTKAMSPEAMHVVVSAAMSAKDDPLYANKNFYIQLAHYKEPIMQQPVFKAFVRQSCPTPTYNQSAFKYNRAIEDLSFLWCLPSKERYLDIIKNPREYAEHHDYKDLAKTVWDDYTGELLKFVIHENGNKPDAIIYNSKERKCLMNQMN